MEKIPEYLFHYTNINTLALMLKNKTIRFNTLNRVDDLNEGITKDLGEMGKYAFVSCWTESSEESIPFWKMYTKDISGVRIRLKSYPFRKYPFPKVDGKIFIDKDTYLRPELFLNDNYVTMPIDEILKKVEYTKDEKLLFPNLIEFVDKYTDINLELLGKYKREEWGFQKEWRYIVIFVPFSWNECHLGNLLIKVFFERIRSKSNLPFEYLDLDINNEALNDMEITLGPCVNEGDKIIVQSLVKKYCPLAIIKNSVLENCIRN